MCLCDLCGDHNFQINKFGFCIISVSDNYGYMIAQCGERTTCFIMKMKAYNSITSMQL